MRQVNGAQAAFPNRQVISMSGDGGLFASRNTPPMKRGNKLVLDHFFQFLDEHFLADPAHSEMASHVNRFSFARFTP
jgi:hypothetical protein